jgi:ribosome maturation factor RimP
LFAAVRERAGAGAAALRSILDEEVVVMASTDSIRALAQPPLASVGLRLWDVEVTADVVRVLVDRDGGIDLDALSDASRVMSALFDAHDEIAPDGQYQLEVSSPGLERTLRTPEHFGEYLGATVTVKTAVDVDGTRRHRGVLAGADETGIALIPETAVADTVPTSIPYNQIERARTVLDWGPAPKPGSRPKTSGHAKKPGSSGKVARRSETPGSKAAAPDAAGRTQDSKDPAR